MSRDDTGRCQAERLRAAGLHVELLTELADVDTADDLVRVASGVPGRRVAELVAGFDVLASVGAPTGSQR
jgi:glycosyltransferase A (GT-A) superfamily protein (DUF2064 family)